MVTTRFVATKPAAEKDGGDVVNDQPRPDDDDRTEAVPAGRSGHELAAGRQPEPTVAPGGRRRPGQVLECGNCGGPVRLARTGRTPKWCSDACRHKAWQDRRALEVATAGEAVDVRIVDRLIEIAIPVPVVEQVEVTVLPTGPAWAPVLLELAAQIDRGRLYDRDLPALTDALQQVLDALHRRPGLGRQHR